MRIAKTAPSGYVLGYASMIERPDGTTLCDLGDDMIDEAEIEKTAHNFLKAGRGMREMHRASTEGLGDLVESMVFTEDKIAALGLEKGALPRGWVVGFQCDPSSEAFGKVMSGDYSMLSIKGTAKKRFVDVEIGKSAGGPPVKKRRGYLEDIDVEEVSLVDAGENYDPETGAGAHVLMWKRAGGKQADDSKPGLAKRLNDWLTSFGKSAHDGYSPRTVAEILAEENTEHRWHRLKWGFSDSLYSILDADLPMAERAAMLQKSVAEFTELAQTLSQKPDAPGDILKSLDRLDSFTPSGDDIAVIKKLADTFGAPMPKRTEDTMTQKNTDTARTLDDVLKGLDAADAEIIKSEIAKSAKGDEPAAVEVQKSEAEIELEKANAALAARVEKMEEEAAFSKVRERVAKDYTHVTGADTDAIAKAIRDVEKNATDPETLKTIDAVFAAVNAAIAGGIAKGAKGTARNDDGEGSALEIVTAKAKELIKADPSKTMAVAITEVVTEDQDLYKAYQDEMSA